MMDMNAKTLFIVTVVINIILLVSCVKNYTCECKQIDSIGETKETFLIKGTRKKSVDECNSRSSLGFSCQIR